MKGKNERTREVTEKEMSGAEHKPAQRWRGRDKWKIRTMRGILLKKNGRRLDQKPHHARPTLRYRAGVTHIRKTLSGLFREQSQDILRKHSVESLRVIDIHRLG